jgi:hypothetical protein
MQEFVVPKSIPRTFAINSVAPFVTTRLASRMPPRVHGHGTRHFQAIPACFRMFFLRDAGCTPHDAIP